MVIFEAGQSSESSRYAPAHFLKAYVPSDEFPGMETSLEFVPAKCGVCGRVVDATCMSGTDKCPEWVCSGCGNDTPHPMTREEAFAALDKYGRTEPYQTKEV